MRVCVCVLLLIKLLMCLSSLFDVPLKVYVSSFAISGSEGKSVSFKGCFFCTFCVSLLRSCSFQFYCRSPQPGCVAATFLQRLIAEEQCEPLHNICPLLACVHTKSKFCFRFKNSTMPVFQVYFISTLSI